MKPHPPPHKIRKTIKWGGAAVTVLLVVVWIGSGWIVSGYEFQSGSRLALEGGTLCINLVSDPNRTPGQGWFVVHFSLGWNWWFDYLGGPGERAFVIPLWFPVALSLIASAVVWRLDTLIRRREHSGTCPKCNYDRTGIAADAVCPECGAAPASASTA